jgi:uncharacterized 2Fe-2S/4Fe-4S cluster protein (DUF4445 family)
MSSVRRIRVELPTGEFREIPISLDNRSLADTLATHGLPLNTRCGQRGLCRGCEVELCQGALKLNGRVAFAPAIIQACQGRLTDEVSIRISERSRAEHRPLVAETFEIDIPYALQPLFEPKPGERDTGFAVDIGTTTVVVLIVDLVTGEVLSRASGFNEQIRFGDNVITRIEAARNPRDLSALQGAIVKETVQPLLMRACAAARRPFERIAGGTIAGNTTMLHLLIGEDPTSLGIAPFIPRFIKGRRISAADLDLDSNGLLPESPIQLLPGIAAYIGADILGGIYASGMAYDSVPSLLVDIGTNGEIVLQNCVNLAACATAAGPAFEGCGLCCGTRAREGAVSDLSLTLNPFRLEARTIGQVPMSRATGLCGSAYVDFLATGKKSGLLNSTGRFNAVAWETVPSEYRLHKGGKRMLSLTGTNGANALRISEVDVALLLQAKAAIGAGIEILLETAGIRAADLGRVYLAGGFGLHLNVANAIAIGILPGIREEQVRVVGNTALAGALMALLDRKSIEEMECLRTRVQVIELNLADNFENCYIEHLMLS